MGEGWREPCAGYRAAEFAQMTATLLAPAGPSTQRTEGPDDP